jgi:5-formyltetrahydrofolate cyclo-ligase
MVELPLSREASIRLGQAEQAACPSRKFVLCDRGQRLFRKISKRSLSRASSRSNASASGFDEDDLGEIGTALVSSATLSLGRRRVMSEHDESNPTASPPCLMDEFAEQLLPKSGRVVEDRGDWAEVQAFRAAERQRLLAARLDVALRERRRREAAVDANLMMSFDLSPYRVLGIYWPIKGEFDLRAAARRHLLSGGVVALPVVVARHAPLEFWRWEPGQPTRPGLWNIPQPVEREAVKPDALLVPLVGFDAGGYRLGYGGGYYDRTLASYSQRPVCIGVGDSEAEIPSIRPQSHDIPMNFIVTDRERRTHR